MSSAKEGFERGHLDFIYSIECNFENYRSTFKEIVAPEILFFRFAEEYESCCFGRCLFSNMFTKNPT